MSSSSKQQSKQTGGHFISVEGQDGAGKTTNLAFICDYLRQHNIEPLVTREPGGTELSELIRELLLGKNIEIAPKTELLLMFAARAQHVEQVIKPALNKSQWVVCDRFTDATYAYQGGGHGVSIDLIKRLENTVLEGFQPDLTLLLDVDVAVGQARTQQRADNLSADRFEKQQLDFKQRVRNTYLQRCSEEPQRIKRINAEQALSQVQLELQQELAQYFSSNHIATSTS